VSPTGTGQYAKTPAQYDSSNKVLFFLRLLFAMESRLPWPRGFLGFPKNPPPEPPAGSVEPPLAPLSAHPFLATGADWIWPGVEPAGEAAAWSEGAAWSEAAGEAAAWSAAGAQAGGAGDAAAWSEGAAWSEATVFDVFFLFVFFVFCVLFFLLFKHC
jgi:hypothetical protein